MSQRDALRSLDADIHVALLDAGLSDIGHYVPKAGGDPIEVRVYVDEAQQAMGEFGQSIGFRTVVGLLLEDVPAPEQFATVTVDGTNYKLESRDRVDQSMSWWVVSRV